MDDVAPRPHASRLLDVVGRDRENRPTVDGAGGDETFFAALAGDRFLGFGHANNIKHDLGRWTSDLRLRTLWAGGVESS